MTSDNNIARRGLPPDDIHPVIFGGEDGPFVQFAHDGVLEEQFDWNDSPSEIARETGAVNLDFGLKDGRLAAVASTEFVDGATIKTAGPRDQKIGIWVLDPPTTWADLPEAFFRDAPVFAPGWTIESVDEERLFSKEDLAAMATKPASNTVVKADGGAGDAVDHLGVVDAEDGEPLRWHDAVVLGRETPEMAALLKKSVSFMLGEIWGERDKRNTPDGDWTTQSLTWHEWIAGSPEVTRSGKVIPAWGFARHPVAKEKHGTAFVPGIGVAGSRKASAIDTMFSMVIDSDSGADPKEVAERLRELNTFGIVTTSFSHLSSGMRLKRDDLLKKLGISGPVTNPDVHRYLHEFSKDHFPEEFIEAVTITDEKAHEPDGFKVICDTPPRKKFRIILPLAEPVRIAALDDRQQEALRKWERKILGLAIRMLRVHPDLSCTDASRAFFPPRHPEGREFECYIVQGDPLRFEDIPEVSKSEYARERSLSVRAPSNAYAAAAGGVKEREPDVVTASGFNLTEWDRKLRHRFMLADLIEAVALDRVRNVGGKGEGRVHIECPNEGFHSTEGGTAAMAANADTMDSGNYAVWCLHDGCRNTKRTQLLAKMIEDEWFPESALTDEAFLLPPSDDEIEEEEAAKAAASLLVQVATDEDMSTYVKARFSRNSTDDEIEKFLADLHQAGGGATTIARAVDALVKPRTVLGRRELNKIVSKATRRTKTMLLDATDSMDIEGTDHSEMVNGTMEALWNMNAITPALFHYVDALAVVQADSDGGKRIEVLQSLGALRKVINDLELFHAVRKDDGSLKVVKKPALESVVQHIWHEDRRKYALPLAALRRGPFFGRGMTLVVVNGYDAANQTFLAMPDDLWIDARFSDPQWVPTEEDVRQALRLIVEEVLGDFWIDGLSRSELLAAAMEGRKAPSLAALIGLIALAFMRGEVDGPTPLHMIDKPVAGTGASLLSEIIGLIVTGRPLASSSLPVSKEEIDKLLTTLFRHGAELVNFDNINHSMDSGEFASALTKKRHLARILGSSNLTEVDVRTIWIGSANTVNMSGELLRRVNPIKLDTHMAKPAERDDFRHPDIAAYVRENRSALVSAILTVIQNWKCKGCPPFSGKPLGSFEVYSRVIGGVVEAAGLVGFLDREHIETWKDEATDDKDGGLRRFMERLARYPVGTVFRSQGKESPRNAATGVVEVGAVVTLLDELNTSCEPSLGEEPILIHGWSYKEVYDSELGSVRYTYGNASAVSKAFAKATRKPHSVMVGAESQTFRVDERKDAKGGTRYWVRIEAG